MLHIQLAGRRLAQKGRAGITLQTVVGDMEEQQLRDQQGSAAHTQSRTEVTPGRPAQQA